VTQRSPHWDVAVVGAGPAGSATALLLARAGARLTVTDIDPGKREGAERLGVRWVEPDEAVVTPGDVFAPCALGGVLDDDAVERLQVAVVAGAANNQLAHDGIALRLHERGILWAPDFIANAGGLINVAAELGDYDPYRVRRAVYGIGDTLRAVFARARAESTTTLAAAEALWVASFWLSGRQHLLVPGWSSLMFMVLIVGGTLMIAIGLVGIYVGYIFQEVKRRPVYLVRAVHGSAGERPSRPGDGRES